MSTQVDQFVTSIDAREAETVQIGPELVTLKVTEAESDNGYLVVQVVTPPGGGPPLHTHPSSEVFFVAEGEFEFPTLRDGKPASVRASAGASVHIPGNAPHTYKNVGSDYGRLVGVLVDGIEMEGFFREAGEIVTDPARRTTMDDPIDFGKLMAAAQKYGLVFFPPDES
jgi:quercetin dioxygenase-like cupin family protein